MKLMTRLMLFVCVLLAPGVAFGQATLVVDDDGEDCPTAAYTTIGAAVGAAIAGDTIQICPGMYPEQVVITTDNLTLVAVPAGSATIQAPASLPFLGSIVVIDGASDVTIQDLVISGPGPSSCASILAGIFVRGGGEATIQGNTIQEIHDNPFGGCQNGIGILVGRFSEATIGSATIEDNDIHGYQKGGIVVSNAGSSATITNNLVTGSGPTETIGQNGIQVSSGATASLTGNLITGNFYSNSRAGSDPNCPEGIVPASLPAGSCLVTATGILFFASGAPGDQGALQTQNTIRRNQLAVAVIP